nr:uncharacterized protein LOC109184184 [Ipomoea trifida]
MYPYLDFFHEQENQEMEYAADPEADDQDLRSHLNARMGSDRTHPAEPPPQDPVNVIHEVPMYPQATGPAMYQYPAHPMGVPDLNYPWWQGTPQYYPTPYQFPQGIFPQPTYFPVPETPLNPVHPELRRAQSERRPSGPYHDPSGPSRAPLPTQTEAVEVAGGKITGGRASPGRGLRSGFDVQVGDYIEVGQTGLKAVARGARALHVATRSELSRDARVVMTRSVSASATAYKWAPRASVPGHACLFFLASHQSFPTAAPTQSSEGRHRLQARPHLSQVGSHDGWVGEDGPRRGKSPRVVAAQYPPATREALLAELPPRPVIAGPTSVPHSLDLSSSQPSASSGEDLVPLSSEDVRNHPCLLTLSELEETTALLTGRVDFQTKRSLGNYPTATRALKNAVVKISAEAYEYWVFRSPDSVAAADLEPPDYSQPEKYVPKKMAGSSTAAPTSGTTKKGRVDFQVGMVSSRLNEVADQWFGFCFPFAGMVLERSFAPLPSGPKKPRPKVTLGGSKAPLPADVPPTQGAVPPLPASSTGTASAAELQVVRPASRRGKEKAADQEVEEIPPSKKQKRPIARGSTPVLDALREGGEHTASFIDKVRAMIPTREAIRDLDTDQVGEMIAQSVLWLSHMTNDLFCRAKAAENVVRKDVVPLRESLAAKDKELTEKVQALEARIASAELEVEAAKRETAEMNERMSSYANLSGFLCRDPREAEAFFRAFIHKEVREELAWRYGAWAHAKGRFEMQQAVREALEESLNEKDFTTVMSVMPDPVPAPGPMPYADPAPGDDAPAPAKAVLLTTGGLAEPPGLKPTGAGLFDLKRVLSTFDTTTPLAKF